MSTYRRPNRGGGRTWRGLFPWRPKFPSRVSGKWDEWYRDWVVSGPIRARITKAQLEELKAEGMIK